MDDKQWQMAEQLAARQYFTVISREESEDGKRYYVATQPDLPGCRADGQTPEEAKQELAKARVDFIYFLLEDNLTVPDPKTYEVKSKTEQFEESIIPKQEPPIPHVSYIVEELVVA
ncbi:MAG: type II toxin-antitoxin system HicB family antitoxin [Anaerolineae bacterium]